MEALSVTIVEFAVLVQLRSAEQKYAAALAEIDRLEDKLLEAEAVEQEQCLGMEVQGIQEGQNAPSNHSFQV
jgi:hypothetical protein